MHTLGHIGLGLLVAVALAAVLGAAGVPGAATASALVVGLSTLPDLDEQLSAIEHRGVTHSLPFAVAVGLATGGTWWLVLLVVSPTVQHVVALVGFLAGSLAILSHLLGDVITPMGVPVFWPFSRRRYSLGLVRSADRRANVTALLVGALAWVAAVSWSTAMVPGAI